MVLHERAARSSEVYKTTVIADILMEQIGYHRFTMDFISLKLEKDLINNGYYRFSRIICATFSNLKNISSA